MNTGERGLTSLIPLLAAFSLLLTGCVGYTPTPPAAGALSTRSAAVVAAPPANPSATPNPTPSPSPEPAPLPSPTAASTRRATTLLAGLSTPLPLELGETRTVPEAGFTFRPLVGFEVRLGEGQATMVSQDGSIIVTFSGAPNPSIISLEGAMDRLLAGVADEFKDFEASDPYPITVDDSQGLAANVTGKLLGEPVNGRVAIVAPAGLHVFYAIGFALDRQNENRWEDEGEKVFEFLMDSITFVDPDS